MSIRSLTLTLGLGTLAGCGSGAVPSPITPPPPPKITIEKPVEHAGYRPGEKIQFAGRVEAKGGAWSPSMITVKIYKDKEFKISEGSFAVKPEPLGTPGEFSYIAEIRAPRRPGAYFVRILGICAAPPGGPSAKDGADEVYKTWAPDREIEVRP